MIYSPIAIDAEKEILTFLSSNLTSKDPLRLQDPSSGNGELLAKMIKKYAATKHSSQKL